MEVEGGSELSKSKPHHLTVTSHASPIFPPHPNLFSTLLSLIVCRLKEWEVASRSPLKVRDKEWEVGVDVEVEGGSEHTAHSSFSTHHVRHHGRHHGCHLRRWEAVEPYFDCAQAKNTSHMAGYACACLRVCVRFARCFVVLLCLRVYVCLFARARACLGALARACVFFCSSWLSQARP